ncbi:kinase-like domain-containing protein [Apodospora peruviana]|uniref:Kinase-like domain-containing protein n=1 Tax=Apodospora peruviana TaxID=516989 RepID=A0AAE0IKG3_9PEZI|nr:kinase-like domain-containing protein [Apodospora peruviana]
MDFSGDHVGLSSSASVASTLSWNTGSSRTRISTLSSAAFSNQGEVSTLSLDGVIQTVKSLNLRQCLYNQVRWEEKLGEGETFIVHRCELRSQDGQNVPLAIKHLKVSTAPDDSTYRRRLKSVILELRIMRHPPLRAHPNITDVFGYGWHKSSNNGTVAGEDADDQVKIMPYLLVPYAVHRTFREYLSVAPGKISIENKEILLGDVASAIAGLHACGIVHGDTKLDNVLVFDSWDRPSATIAKLADFGHSIVLGNTRQEGSDEPLRYTGTFP